MVLRVRNSDWLFLDEPGHASSYLSFDPAPTVSRLFRA